MIRDITRPGRYLKRRFDALGDLRGKTLREIIDATAQPVSFSAATRGRKLVQWQATGFHIALLFDGNDKFVAITHLYARFVSQEAIAAAETSQAIAWLIAIPILIIIILAFAVSHL
jgi:hypothetical protein